MSSWPEDARPRVLLMDAGFLSAAWLSELVEHGITVLTRLPKTMVIAKAAVIEAREAHPSQWHKVKPPQRPRGERVPTRRRIWTGSAPTGWGEYHGPLSLCVVHDHYADGKEDYWVLASTNPKHDAREIHAQFRERWGLEETFMALSRYHHLNALGACRPGLLMAKAHFTLCAYTVRHACRKRAAEQRIRHGFAAWQVRSKRLVVYAGPHYAILMPSAFFRIAFANWEAWSEHQEDILAALHYCEGPG
jgi:hypothetical protein